MFTAQVYTVKIVCLSGLMDEMYVAYEVIRNWNYDNASQKGKLFFPLADNATIGETDCVIGIVGNYIDKAEVVGASITAGKKVLLFFSKYQDPKNSLPSDGKAVVEFRKQMGLKCTCCDFNGMKNFEKSLEEHLEEILS